MARETEPMENLKKYRKSGLEHFIKFVRELPVIPPKKIFTKLEEAGYRGQDEARRAVSLMAYRHVKRIKRIYLDGAKREHVLPKSNFLLIGPTGCGKTHLVELLFQNILRLPTVIVDITTYSETGYVGQDPNTIITRLLHAADDNPLLASIGIICLDEFDKIASGQNNAIFAGAGTTKDVTGMGVQRELLKMFEAGEVVVPLELTHSTYGDHIVMSTGDIAFIAAGAFSGFQQVARRRGAVDRIGFGREKGKIKLRGGAGAQDQIAVSFTTDEVENIANFQAYGFLPELMARFTRIVPFRALDEGTLKAILRTNVIERLTREFEDEGFKLVVTEPALDHVVRESLKRETGARGLAAILTRHLEDAAFEAFADHPGGDVRLDVEGGELNVKVG
ncbi:MAG: ATPase domain protein [Myxococcales bacterium]|nr:ATPase domain protein [Myxococcales bacterium]